MRFFQKTSDGGSGSGVTGYFLIELKSLFTIVLLRFGPSTREAFHSHAFNAITLWIRGSVREQVWKRDEREWKAGDVKFTPRALVHRIVPSKTGAWALSIRGPWVDRWNEVIGDKIVTLTHGRKIVAEL